METQGRITLAAGMVKTVEDVERALKLPVDEITVGSITVTEKLGNSEPAFTTDGSGNYWNAIGLKNSGLAYYTHALPEISKLVHQAGRKLVVSISGNTPSENQTLAQAVTPYADAVELNLACPNIVTSDGGRKPLIGYTANAVKDHMDAMVDVVQGKSQNLRLKVPPYFDLDHLVEVGNVIRFYQNCGWFRVTSFVATNTMPNCLPLHEDGSNAISVGYAGGSGAQLHALAVGNVKKWRELLPVNIDVVGVGGIREGVYARNFERVGAARCQMAGAFYHEGEKAFQHVLQGLYA